jgi:hypothetical protein
MENTLKVKAAVTKALAVEQKHLERDEEPRKRNPNDTRRVVDAKKVPPGARGDEVQGSGKSCKNHH